MITKILKARKAYKEIPKAVKAEAVRVGKSLPAGTGAWVGFRMMAVEPVAYAVSGVVGMINHPWVVTNEANITKVLLGVGFMWIARDALRLFPRIGVPTLGKPDDQ